VPHQRPELLCFRAAAHNITDCGKMATFAGIAVGVSVWPADVWGRALLFPVMEHATRLAHKRGADAQHRCRIAEVKRTQCRRSANSRC
jgi:hypothetical protein